MGSERYEVLELLGRGGMGEVYLAYDQDIRRKVALKLVRTDHTQQAARFIEEAQVMGQLEHPNIVPVYDIGATKKGKFYYTMRVVRGRTLASVLKALRAAEDADAELRRHYSLTRGSTAAMASPQEHA